MKDTLEKL